MKVVRKFEAGKYYQFTGYPIIINPEDPSTWSGNYDSMPMDDPHINSLMDRQPRLARWVDGRESGTMVLFSEIYMPTMLSKIPWDVPRDFKSYLDKDMFVEVEVVLV
jgi:hypothetical protein